jgi:DMSO/TMAO reductase YedYZ molybdopterin-dependent catalytic subunit
MKKATKIAILAFVVLVAASVPLYFYTRPTPLPANVVLMVQGNVAAPQNISLSQLQTYQPTTVQVTLTSSSKAQDNGVFNYTGVTLSALLADANIHVNATSVYIQASDNYGATLTMKEAMDPNTIIAYQKDGAPLSLLKNNGEGPLRLIIGGDQYAQRWVKGVSAIQVG